MSVRNGFSEREGLAVGVLCVAQLALWTLAPALTHSAPPLDVVEMLTWGRAGVVATYKHPNLPGLVLETVRRMSFGELWPVYIVPQAFIAATFVAVYLLGRDLLGPRRALVGTLLLTGIFYFSWPTPEMNHNVAQMPLWAWVCLALRRATHGDRLVWWIALGTLAGIAVWAKYSSVLLLVAALGWAVSDGQARKRFASMGPWIALGIAAAVVLPQVRFLMETPLSPIDYALARASHAGGAPGFVLAQLADHGVFFLMAAAAGLIGPRAFRRGASDAAALRFLLVLGVGPVVLLLSLTFIGLGLKDMWGAPMFNLSGLLFAALVPGRVTGRCVIRLAAMAAALLVVVPTIYAVSVVRHDVFSDTPPRVAWPRDAITNTLIEAAALTTGQLPAVVAGPVWTAGLVALGAPGRPQVLIDGDLRKSPWVSVEDVARGGILAVWPSEAAPGAELRALIGDRPIHEQRIPWTDSITARAVRLSWAAIPARDPETRTPDSRDK